MSDDIAAFLKVRLDEDEAAARAATPGPWSVDDETYAESINSGDGTAVVAGGRWGGEASVFDSTDDALHIARHDPARVLAEVAAKRQLLRAHEKACSAGRGVSGEPTLSGYLDGYAEGLMEAIQICALPYTDHLDYKEAWRP